MFLGVLQYNTCRYLIFLFFERSYVYNVFLGGSVFSFLCCPIVCFYVLSSVLRCPLRFLHKKLCSVRLYLQLFSGGLVSYLRYICFLAYSGVNTYCVVFLFFCLRLVCPMLSVSLDCPFLIAPLVFSNVYFVH
jgi:hypothetical protein